MANAKKTTKKTTAAPKKKVATKKEVVPETIETPSVENEQPVVVQEEEKPSVPTPAFPNGQDNMEIVDQILETAKTDAEKAMEMANETPINTPIDEEAAMEQIQEIIEENKIPEMENLNTTDPKEWVDKIDEEVEKATEMQKTLEEKLNEVKERIDNKTKKTLSGGFSHKWNGVSDAWFS